MTEIDVALIDDHQLVRDGIKALLLSMQGINVVAEANTGRQAVAIARKQAVDVFVMDIAMADLNGLEATKRIVRDNADAKVIVLSMHSAEEFVIRSLQYGARGYLIKNTAPGELEVAIRKVAGGRIYLSSSIGESMRRHILQQSSAADTREVLSSRQREVLQAIAEGHSTRDIAVMLSISPKTVETHRSQIMQKLGVDHVAGLVRYAIRHGIIEVD